MLQNASKASKGVVVVITNPVGANISSNGLNWSHPTPYLGPLAPGIYHVSISLQGYQTVQRDITVEVGKAAAVNVQLKPQ